MRFALVLTILFFTDTISASTVGRKSLSFRTHHELQLDPITELPQVAFSVSLPPNPLKPTLTIKAKPTIVHRPKSIEALHHARTRSLKDGQCTALEWDQVEILGPDVDDKHTLIQLARMAGDAYAVPGRSNWYELDSVWNQVGSFYFFTCAF